MKYFVGWARVSSREQEREGFSLEVQVDAINDYVKKQGGVILNMFQVAETATTSKQRIEFAKMLDFIKKNKSIINAIVIYKYDRFSRNMKDWASLEEIEKNYEIQLISITQPSENTPSGRFTRRLHATTAAYQTEQQSIDIKDGIEKRVQSGWFPSNAPFGYKNKRIDDRSTVKIDREKAFIVKRAFELRTKGLTVEEIAATLYEECLYYSNSKHKFTLSKLNAMLQDKSYIGYVKYNGKWCNGRQSPIIDEATWNAVQNSFKETKYRSHLMAFASELMICHFCGRPITGETKTKPTKNGEKTYIYYRCARYQADGHPKTRLTEAEVEEQIHPLLAKFSCHRPELAEFVKNVARCYLSHQSEFEQQSTAEIKRQISLTESKQKELLDLLTENIIKKSTYIEKQATYNETVNNLEEKLALLERQKNEEETKINNAPNLFNDIQNNWNDFNHRQKNDLLRLIFGKLMLNNHVIQTGERIPLELFQNL